MRQHHVERRRARSRRVRDWQTAAEAEQHDRARTARRRARKASMNAERWLTDGTA